MKAGLFLLPVLALAVSGCALVPGDSYVPEIARIDNRHHDYRGPTEPDLGGSYVLGVPKLNPVWWFLNTDGPVPDWYLPDETDEKKRQRSWLLRNPMHNFTHYVIGISDRYFHRRGLFAKEIFNPNGGFNVHLISAGPFIHVPFVSYHNRYLEFYLGWRTKGNFGAALRRPD